MSIWCPGMTALWSVPLELDVGFDTEVTAGSISRLAADAISVMPELSGYALAEASAGLRPMTPDGFPMIGRPADSSRTVLATGHGRNGLLLAPITADLVLAELSGEPLSGVDSALVQPNRFPEIAANARIAT